VLRAIEAADARRPAPAAAAAEVDPERREAIVAAAPAGLVAESGAPGAQPLAILYQDFQLRCRMLGLAAPALDLPGFQRRLAMARAGIEGEGWDEAVALGAALPEDMLAVLLRLARAAREGAPCPDDAELAALYGTTSPGRLRRVLAFIEAQGMLVVRVDLSGRRSVSLPALGWTSAAGVAETGEEPKRRSSRRS
jgi:hypothetical protein